MTSPTGEKPLIVQFPHHPGQFGGYGRNIRHDPRSKLYRVRKTAAPTTKKWTHRIAILDQGQLGSCTGNATVGCLGTDPFYGTLSKAQQDGLNEDLAIQIYSAATRIDDYAGWYNIATGKVDTGSDGLSVAKAAQTDGYISGYQHVLSVGGLYAAILDGPFIVGTAFYSEMESPDNDGLVHVKGVVIGGHEYLCIGYDASTDLWEFVNSWGDSWGVGGHFFMSTKDFTKLLAAQGDATPFVPINKPAPTPVPPTPTPGPSADINWGLVDPWLADPHGYHKSSVASREIARVKTATGSN